MEDFLEDFLDLITYTCPYTGKKRCAAQAALELSGETKKQKPAGQQQLLIFQCHVRGFFTTFYFNLSIYHQMIPKHIIFIV